MSKAMQLVGILLLGIFTLVIINLMNDVRSTDELDYYLLQEVTEASMYDAVDYSYYRETGLLKVDRDMFLESFNRRFAESVQANREYEIKIVDFNETPPKVSIEVTAPTVATVKGEVALITNRVSGIIETIYDDYVYSRGDYKSDNFDESKPTIQFIEVDNTTYEVKINDDLYLKGYKVIKMDNSNKNSAEKICTSVTDWDNPGRWPNSIVFEQTLTVSDTGYWIAAMDGVGNCTVKPLSDINPWLSLTYNKIPSDTTLVANLYDDHGLSKYYIAPNTWSTDDVVSKCSSNSSICKDVDISGRGGIDHDTGYYTYSFKTTLKDLGLDYDTYRLFVVDNKGRITKSTEDLALRESHKPKVTYTYSATSATAGTLKLIFNDTGNDLYGYKYSTSNNTPVNDTDYSKDWVSTSEGMTATMTNVKEGTYYVWARDKQDEYTKMTLKIDLEEITKKPTCADGGTYDKSTGKCNYTSNEGQCGKTGYGCSDCYTYDMMNGECNSWSETTCTIANTCDFVTYQCGPHTTTCHNKACEDAFRSVCVLQGYAHRAVRTDNKQHWYCGESNKTGNICNTTASEYVKNKKDPVCQGYEQVKNPATCRYGCDGYTPKSCSKDPNYEYVCPDGYKNSNDKACVKATP